MSNSLYIWGAGFYGEIAFHYYKKTKTIEGYIDKNPAKWGQKLNGIEILSPDVLRCMQEEPKVIIAMERHAEEVKKELADKYGIERCQIFRIDQEDFDGRNKERIYDLDDETFIVSFTSGLGNQMFQYALFQYLREKNRKACADTSWYTVLTDPVFSLTNVFPTLDINICGECQRNELIDQIIRNRKKVTNYIIYQEAPVYTVDKLQSYVRLEDYSGGYLKGYFQTFQYANAIEETLRKDFSFLSVKDTGMKYYESIIRNSCTVGVHVRRGDYITGANSWMYKDICTDSYYSKSIDYIRKKYPNCTICFFSNEIEWVKRHYDFDNAIYVEEKMFEKYYDWYDMYLMSICDHNVIANSSFSWWGAWLNQNKEKSVIAPAKWNNACEYLDIYPIEWITI